MFPCCFAGPTSTNDSASGNTTDTAAASPESTLKDGADPSPAPEHDIPALESAADAEARTVTSSLSPNATNQEVALASAKAAIIYQMASEATSVTTTTATTTTTSNEVIKASEAAEDAVPCTKHNTHLPQLLVDRLTGLQVQN